MRLSRIYPPIGTLVPGFCIPVFSSEQNDVFYVQTTTGETLHVEFSPVESLPDCYLVLEADTAFSAVNGKAESYRIENLGGLPTKNGQIACQAFFTGKRILLGRHDIFTEYVKKSVSDLYYEIGESPVGIEELMGFLAAEKPANPMAGQKNINTSRPSLEGGLDFFRKFADSLNPVTFEYAQG